MNDLLKHLPSMVGGLILFMVAVVDAWHFHSFGLPLDGLYMVVGLGALGVPVYQLSGLGGNNNPPTPPAAS